jgi:hypothetical protein
LRSEEKVIVSRILADRWRGAQCDEDVIESPSADDFARALAALDARERTMLCLHVPDGRQLTIGGGNGKYVVYAALSKDEFWNLLIETAENGTVSVTAGGQEGDFPAEQVVDQTQALRAGLAFMESGKLDPTLCWKRHT